MADGYVMQLATMMVLTAAKLAAPLLLTALLIGFAVSLIQALTQLQDQTIAFVPKIIGVGVANALLRGRDGTSGVDWDPSLDLQKVEQMEDR